MKLGLLVIACFFFIKAEANIYYVDQFATGAQTGTSWVNASTDLQSVFNLLSDGDTVFVAAGTYEPAANSSYSIKNNNIKLFGGFPHGGNPGLDNRNWLVYQSLIKGDGALSIFGNLNNYSGTTIIDGFFMTGAGSHEQGGVAYLLGSFPIQISNCNFYNNSSSNQGGIFYDNSCPAIFDHCTFTGNNGSAEGGLLFMEVSSPTVTHCIFTNNNETASGGMIFAVLGSPQFSYSTFSNNILAGAGGVLYLDLASTDINQCTFLNNTLADGLFYCNEGSVQITNSIFSENIATHSAILEMIMSNSPSSFTNCVFNHNQATENAYGGLFYNSNSPLSITNSTLYANTSSGFPYSSLFHNYSSATTDFNNCIIWGNSFVNLASQQMGILPAFHYSLVQGITDPANFVANADPLFVNPSNPIGSDGIWATPDDGLALLSTSQAVDKGNNAAIPSGITKDIDGNNRIINSIVDLGAYEYYPRPGPMVLTSTGNTNYTVLSPPTVIDKFVTISDANSPTLASATVSITANFSPGDSLNFINLGTMGNITGSYNASIGVLSLTSNGATASLAQWKAALESITFSTTLSPNLSPRNISFLVNDGTYARNTGNKMIILISSCISTKSITNKTICATSLPYSWNNQTFTKGGTYIVHLTNTGGCDSAATLNLIVHYPGSSITHESLCANSLPYFWNGQNYTSSGTYTVHLTNSLGCDSTAILNLTVRKPSSSLTSLSVCASSLPFSWNGQNFNRDGTYTVHLNNTEGCDSAATLVLSVKTIFPSSITNIHLCQNALPYSWNGMMYNSFGTFTAKFPMPGACDSIATLNLFDLGSSLSDSNRFSLKLSPNPVRTTLTATVTFPCGIIVFKEIPNITIYDILGRKMLQQSMSLDTLEINVSNLPLGIYIIQYTGNGYQSADKFLKW